MSYEKYFAWRGVDQSFYAETKLPCYLKKILPSNKTAKILDFGCGFCQNLLALQKMGYENSFGLDISDEALAFAATKNIPVLDGRKINFDNYKNSLDLIILSHVLEHLPKNKIISTVAMLRMLLKQGGKLIVMVPNAQSNTDAYWAYEDFTHETLFTSGSIYYVLRAAGFEKIEFLDVDCTDGKRWIIKVAKRLLLRVYKTNKLFWNYITSSSYHKPSVAIFSYEIKILAEKE